MIIKIPNEVQYIIETLQSNGHQAYIVGGCVRDSVLGKESKDWDICTSALPEQTMKCFDGHRIIETGLRHGTITLILNHMPFEITTYRIDGKYSDNRRPDTVEFVSSLKADLSRRDFTINAMAYNPDEGIVDFFFGMNDLQNGIIRCVGDAGQRFQEDALRIMRALRFASVLGFSIDGDTSKAMLDNCILLKNIAVERIASEINKMIIGDGFSGIILNHLPVIAEIIPEIMLMNGFEQNNPYHCHDVLKHSLLSIDHAPKDVVIRLTMLFHDIAKPKCYTESNGAGHFYGHPQISSEMAKTILLRLKYDNNTIKGVTELILYHEADIQPKREHIKRWLNKFGEAGLRQLIEVKRADAMAQSVLSHKKKLGALDKISGLINEIIGQQQCFSLKELAVNGNDLLAAGFEEGARIGVILNRLMEMVINEKVKNNKDELMKQAHRLSSSSLNAAHDNALDEVFL